MAGATVIPSGARDLAREWVERGREDPSLRSGARRGGRTVLDPTSVGLQQSSVLASYSLISARLDEASIEALPMSSLPAGWRNHPPSEESQAIGDRWVAERRSAVLRVPSAIIEVESNYLLNPGHPEFGRITISAPVPFAFDARLIASRRTP
jgi:RES domain-containing protein